MMNVPHYYFRNLEAPLYQSTAATLSEVQLCYQSFLRQKINV
jgi:hypothetical protein